MANENRKGILPSNRRTVKFFFFNDNLYKVLRVNRSEDIAEAWNFRDAKVEVFLWSDVRKKSGRAYMLEEASGLLGKSRVTLERYILKGDIERPQQAYSLEISRKPGRFYLQDKDVIAIHDFFLTVSLGRPKVGKKPTPKLMPTKVELRAMMQHDTIMYIKTEEGNFVPAWKEVEW